MKRSTKTAAELQEWVVKQVRQDPDCKDFSAEFSVLPLGKQVEADLTWDVQTVRTEQRNPDCLGRFQRAVEDAKQRFDLKP